MKLKNSLSLLALASCAAISTSALAQSSGTIDVKGNILPVTCSPTVNGGSGGAYTVNLPDVHVGQFTGAGSTAGAVEIKFEWTGCTTGAITNAWVHFGDGGSNVDGDGLIIPTAGSNKMRFELLDGLTGPRVRAGGTAGTTGPGLNQGTAAGFTGADPSKVATKTYAVRYYATQGLALSDAAPLASSVTYNAYYY